ncbi:MAG: DUF2304 domain-containing protein [Micrococcaceae bacterium]
MRLFFQIFLIVVILAAFFRMTTKATSLRSQALRRIAFLLFAIVTLSSVIFPSQLTFLANFLGIGRGTDLLLYGTILVLFTFIASSSSHSRTNEKNMTRISRKMALNEARYPKSFEHTKELNS